MKKAQIKLGETIAVLIVFFILLMVALVIYSGFKTKSIEKKRSEANDMRAIEIATKATLLPELQCSEYQCIGCSGAIDLIKLDAMTYAYEGEGLSGIERNMVKYAPMFGKSYIKFMASYPGADYFSSDDKFGSSGEPSGIWDLYNSSYPANIPVRVRPIFLPVNLYNAYTDECYFGVVEVGMYEK